MSTSSGPAPLPRRHLVVVHSLLTVAVLVGGWTLLPGAAHAGTPAPSVTVTAVDLVDGQIVRVEGQGFPPNSELEIFQCAGDAVDAEGCDGTTAFGLHSDADGHTVFDFQVDARIHLGFDDPTPFDCRREPAGCRVGIGLLFEHESSAFAPLAFDPSAPLRPPVAATVEPTTGLGDGATVTVAARHLAPRHVGWVLQCRAGGAPRACDIDRALRLAPDRDGTLRTDLVVRAAFRSPLGDDVDCTAAPGTCAVVVSWGFAFVPDRFAEAPLSFTAGTTSTSTSTSTTTSTTTTTAVPTEAEGAPVAPAPEDPAVTPTTTPSSGTDDALPRTGGGDVGAVAGVALATVGAAALGLAAVRGSAGRRRHPTA